MRIKTYIVTQMDITQRAGIVLAASDIASLALCNVSISSKVADGSELISPIYLAPLIRPHIIKNPSNQQNTEAT